MHRIRLPLLCMVLVLLLGSVNAGDDPVETGLRSDADATLFSKLLASLKLKAEEEKTSGTWFVPTDRAINAFLGEMGMTADELLARPQLVDAILSYHFVPGVALKDFGAKVKDGKEDLISTNEKEPSILKTGDVGNDIEIFRSPNTGASTLVDAQGNRASVVGKPTEYGKMVFWDVSNVLLSGQYFVNTRAAVKYYPEWTSFQELYQRATQTSKALETAIAGRTAYTYLLPSNDALKPAMQALSKAGTADLSQLLEYHVLPELRPIPTGWKDGESVKTLLKGRDIKAKLGESTYTDPFDGSSKQGPELTLVPEVGKPANVNVQNVYAGKSILQGIDAPLLPNTAIAKALGVSDTPKTAKEGGAAANGRKLLQGGGRGSGRSSGSGSQRNNVWAAQNTQAAIRAAAKGRTPASYATASGSRNAHAAGSRCVNCVNWQGL